MDSQLVARNSRLARTANERFKEIDSKAAELSRSVGRGSSALRDSGDNVLSMRPESATPLIGDDNTDSGLRWQYDGLHVVSSDGGSYKNMTAAYLSSQGGASVVGELNTGGHTTNTFVANSTSQFNDTATFGQINAYNISCNVIYPFEVRSSGGIAVGQALSTGGTAFIGGGIKIGDAGNPVNGQIQTREMTTVGNVAIGGNLYLTGTFYNSDRRIKRNIEPLQGSALQAFRDLDWPSWEYLPSPTNNGIEESRRRVMAMAQDMQANPIFSHAVIEGIDVSGEDDDILRVELATLVGIMGAALHEAGDELEALRSEYLEYKEKTDARLARLEELLNE